MDWGGLGVWTLRRMTFTWTQSIAGKPGGEGAPRVSAKGRDRLPGFEDQPRRCDVLRVPYVAYIWSSGSGRGQDVLITVVHGSEQQLKVKD